jgi:hypothetical protein
MRYLHRVLGATALLAVVAHPAFAEDCQRPANPPVVPDGAKATVDQFKAAHPLMQAYVQALDAYKNCLDGKIKQLPQGTKPDVVQKLRDAGGSATDEAKTLSSAYQDQVKIFKTAGQGRSLGAH